MTRMLKFFLITVVLLFASSADLPAASTKQESTLPRLSEVHPRYQDAASAVAAVLVGEKEEPKEFRVRVEEKHGGKVLVFRLWHDSAFTPENERFIGNPGGRCRDIEYDVESRKASQSLYWQ